MTYTFAESERVLAVYAGLLGVEAKLVTGGENPPKWRYWAYVYRGAHQIIVGPGFFKLTKSGQIAVLIHELLHVKHVAKVVATRRGFRQQGVHTGAWKEAALDWGKRVLFIPKTDMLPEWREHPYAKKPAIISNA